MKTPNFTVSKLQVLDAISDQISIDIVTAISNNVTNSDSIMKLLDLSRKQYYSRCSRLYNIGLVSKQNGEMILTSFWTNSLQCSIENCHGVLIFFDVEDNRCNKFTFGTVGRSAENYNR